MWQEFVEAVRRQFGFLETEFGFVVKSTRPPLVVYESDKLRLLFLYDVTRGHELDLTLRRLTDDVRKPLSLGIEMLEEFKEIRCARGDRTSYPSTSEALEFELARLAERLRLCGMEVLRGDLRPFQWLQQREQELAKKFGRPQQSSE